MLNLTSFQLVYCLLLDYQQHIIFLILPLPGRVNVRCRVLWRKTIGAGTRVRLGFPNARPVVSDEPARSSAGQ